MECTQAYMHMHGTCTAYMCMCMHAHPCQIASEMTGFVTMEASSIAKVNVANGVRLTPALTLTLTLAPTLALTLTLTLT